MTPREVCTLDLIRERLATLGWAPSYQEIGHHLAVSSKATVARVIDRLVLAGKLERTGGERGLRLADVPDLRSTPSDVMIAELRRRGLDTSEPRRLANGREKTCAADTCGAPVRVGHLMCREHWFQLPRDLQRGLVRTSAAGEVVAFERLLTRAKDIADGLTAEMRSAQAGSWPA